MLKSETYDAEAAYNALVGGNLVYTAGGNASNAHAWVGDGAFISSSPHSAAIAGCYSLRCNWGWNGFCDGFFLYFNLSKGGSPDAIDQQPGGSTNDNYNYSAQMVIMKR